MGDITTRRQEIRDALVHRSTERIIAAVDAGHTMAQMRLTDKDKAALAVADRGETPSTMSVPGCSQSSPPPQQKSQLDILDRQTNPILWLTNDLRNEEMQRYSHPMPTALPDSQTPGVNHQPRPAALLSFDHGHIYADFGQVHTR
ncbi:hypothetical protein GOPIP_031_01700 [Gordonia polyisoprenivorans NBRC 16320 = JCM 10675]|uniref:Uncharacterized protein n=1 Tax=Gordonia polyisoprenivorans TaxID=84595 RepID=A0A846WHK0_9ACTN|nr:hypothetical protein [Gordonia polyisoprenivorans]NKY00938.1 hypothetical protein [Gordonia polyisoprenivorans]UZF56752.1 hypothetical protein LH935_01695 [Gordonia polyisoprenivorans]GAB22550.1 hypothetical protein GOPIP_031_01700 [Gordonia polyisoprenivorans NBRC 16320 = JCM 10675]